MVVYFRILSDIDVSYMTIEIHSWPTVSHLGTQNEYFLQHNNLIVELDSQTISKWQKKNQHMQNCRNDI